MQLELKGDVHSLTLWLTDVFDERYSFRGTLSLIESVLGDATKVRHELPDLKFDDFMDGRLVWGGREFRLYWERPLGYMQLSSQVAADVRALRDALRASGSIG